MLLRNNTTRVTSAAIGTSVHLCFAASPYFYMDGIFILVTQCLARLLIQTASELIPSISQRELNAEYEDYV